MVVMATLFSSYSSSSSLSSLFSPLTFSSSMTSSKSWTLLRAFELDLELIACWRCNVLDVDGLLAKVFAVFDAGVVLGLDLIELVRLMRKAQACVRTTLHSARFRSTLSAIDQIPPVSCVNSFRRANGTLISREMSEKLSARILIKKSKIQITNREILNRRPTK